MPKLLRITTVAASLKTLLPGQLTFMREHGVVGWAASAFDAEAASDRTTGQAQGELEGWAHFHLPLTRQITLLRDLWALCVTWRLIWRLRPDIVHTHTPKAGLIGMGAAWLARVPVRIHTVAGLPLMERRGLMRGLLVGTERMTYFFATAVWPNSFELQAYIRDHLYRGRKLRVIGNGSSNGIDSSYFQTTAGLQVQAQDVRTKLGIPTKTFVWVFVGRIAREKGIEELVEAFCALKSSGYAARLLLVGAAEECGPVGPRTQAVIADNPDIDIVGYQADVRPYLILADALALPSYREGLPNVLLQAACLERPVVASAIVGCRELVRQGETGLLVPPKKVEALAQAMGWLMDHPDSGRQMGKNARVQVVARYNQHHLWQCLLAAYRESLITTSR